MDYVTRENQPSSINVIPTSFEKFISFDIGYLRFLNNRQKKLLTVSIDVLVKYLIIDGRDKSVYTTRHYPGSDLDVFPSKGV